MPPRPNQLEQPDLQDYTAPSEWSTTDPFAALRVDRLVDRIARKAFRGYHDLTLSNPYFQDDLQANHAWKPVRMLGKGAYGAVALWEKMSTDSGEVIDELAIKEQDRTKKQAQNEETNQAFEIAGREGLLREAVVQRDLVVGQQSEYIVPLRRYKYFDNDQKYRLYFVHCPHQSLDDLITRYRIWDTQMPELWLWSVFRDMLKAAAAMEQPPPGDNQALQNMQADQTQEHFVIHVDFKPSNVLLDYCPEADDDDDILTQYPRALLADFGIAKYVRPAYDASTNPHQFWGTGTTAYNPPEERGYGREWIRMPNGNPGFWQQDQDEKDRWLKNGRGSEDWYRDQKIFFTHKWNVYSVGKIMYELMNIARQKSLDKVMLQDEEEVYNNYNGHSIRPQNLVTGEKPKYSNILCSLIWDCLHPNPERRPAASQMLARIKVEERIEFAAQAVRDARPNNAEDTPAPSEKLYFEANSINEMPQGNFGCQITEKERRYLLQAKDRDPDWPMLMPPDGPRWRTFKDAYDLNNIARTRGEHYVLDDELHFGEAPANTDHPATASAKDGRGEGPGVAPEPGARHPPRHTAAEYMTMTVAQMRAELEEYRNVDKKETRGVKKALVERLMQEDGWGNHGRGVWTGNVAQTKKRKDPVATEEVVDEGRKLRKRKGR